MKSNIDTRKSEAVPHIGLNPAIIRDKGLTNAQAETYTLIIASKKDGSNIAPQKMDAMLRLKTSNSEYARKIRALAGIYLFDKTDSCKHFSERKNETAWGGAIAYARYAAYKYARNNALNLPDAIELLIDRQAESRKTYDSLGFKKITRNPSLSTVARIVNTIDAVNKTAEPVDAHEIVTNMYKTAQNIKKRTVYSGAQAVKDTLTNFEQAMPDIADGVIESLCPANADLWGAVSEMWETFWSKLYKKGRAILSDYGRADYDTIQTGIRQTVDCYLFRFNKSFGAKLSRKDFHTLCSRQLAEVNT